MISFTLIIHVQLQLLETSIFRKPNKATSKLNGFSIKVCSACFDCSNESLMGVFKKVLTEEHVIKYEINKLFLLFREVYDNWESEEKAKYNNVLNGFPLRELVFRL